MRAKYAVRLFVLLILCSASPLIRPAWGLQVTGAFDARTISKRLIPCVVEIYVYDENGQQAKEGSGFILSRNGLIATNFHVIDGGHSAKVVLKNNDAYPVEGVLEFDPGKDFAILKINAVELPVAPIGNSELLEPGDNLVAIGAPLGFSYTVTTGIVSQIRSRDEYHVIQHSAPISPGSSGGPLVNDKGQVIGINTFLVKGGNSIFFALPVNYVRAALENSKGEMYSISQLSKAVAQVKEQIANEELVTAIRDNFISYNDPEGLFSLAVPRGWPVQTTVKETNDGGYTRHVVFMAHSPNAEQAKIGGWLSEGVRIHMQFPQQGQKWRMSGVEAWYNSEFKAVFEGYDKYDATEVRDEKFGNAQSKAVVVVGNSAKLSRPEASIFYVSASPRCFMTVEVTTPADKKDELKVINTIVGTSFKANWLQ